MAAFFDHCLYERCMMVDAGCANMPSHGVAGNEPLCFWQILPWCDGCGTSTLWCMVPYTICHDTSLERNNSLYHRLHHTASVCCVWHADRCNLLIEVWYHMVYGMVRYRTVPRCLFSVKVVCSAIYIIYIYRRVIASTPTSTSNCDSRVGVYTFD